MQIVIPMSGIGSRFIKADYQLPKPLIEVDGYPIIKFVIDLFPGESDFYFICNKNHINDSYLKMKETILKYCPSGKIITINPHKLGPIHAVQKIKSILDPKKPVIINYCDFTCYWKWNDFKNFLTLNNCAGSIPAYKNFHPHSLGNTNYAYLKEKNGIVSDIQEKKPFTKNRIIEFASSGTYYFQTAEIMNKAFEYVIANRLQVNGEYYVSMAYKYLFEIKKIVTVYPIQHFMQWGTPEDLEEYLMWSNFFRKIIENKNKIQKSYSGTNIIPMAGLGKRFEDKGYKQSKPLIEVSGNPMFYNVIKNLPSSKENILIIRSDLKSKELISKKIKKLPNNFFLKEIYHKTQGQACTVIEGLKDFEKKYILSDPIVITACDSGIIYNKKKYNKILNDNTVDIIIWCYRGYTNAIRYPEMYGWVNEINDKVLDVSVKKPLSNPKTDPVIIGTFTFKKKKSLYSSAEKIFKNNIRVNGEFYVDSCINEAIQLGYKCKIFEVDAYLCWGTPNDLQTFNYWQSCFHKWEKHPYSMDLDKSISSKKILHLKNKASEFELFEK